MDWLDQNVIFKLYIVGFVGSLIAQTITQARFGRLSAWGISRGWQNEIAIWNIFAALILTVLVLHKVHSILAVAALAALSAGFGLNHLVAYLGERKVSNLQGTLANAAGILVICLWALLGH